MNDGRPAVAHYWACGARALPLRADVRGSLLAVVISPYFVGRRAGPASGVVASRDFVSC